MRYANTQNCIVPLPWIDTDRDTFIKPFGSLGQAKLSYYVQDPDDLTGSHAKHPPEYNRFPKLTLLRSATLESLHDAFLSSFRKHIIDIEAYSWFADKAREGISLLEKLKYPDMESYKGEASTTAEIIFYHTHNTLDAHIGLPMLVSHQQKQFWPLHQLPLTDFNLFPKTANTKNFGSAILNIQELISLTYPAPLRIIEYLTSTRLCPYCGILSDHSLPRTRPFSSRKLLSPL